MAWIYSRESEEFPWPSLLGCAPSPTASATSMLVACSCRGWPTINCAAHQFGMTLGLYERKISAASKSISSAEDSPAKTFPVQDLEQVWTESEADFTAKSSDLRIALDHDSFFWRTSPQSERVAQTTLRKTWPRSGMMRDGRLSKLPPLVPPIDAIDGGYLPTPTAASYGSSQNGSNANRPSGGTPSLQTRLRQNKKLLPTPTVADSRATARATTTTGISHDGETLTDATRSLTGISKALLSPRFVEWMMGFPIGWSDCDRSVTPSFHSPRE